MDEFAHPYCARHPVRGRSLLFLAIAERHQYVDDLHLPIRIRYFWIPCPHVISCTWHLNEEVFKTIDRTGILIFISAEEHKVVVLADSGINAKVQHSDWDHIVELIVDGIKTEQLTEGIVNGINECKKLLLHHGFVVREDDTNELSDDIRIN